LNASITAEQNNSSQMRLRQFKQNLSS